MASRVNLTRLSRANLPTTYVRGALVRNPLFLLELTKWLWGRLMQKVMTASSGTENLAKEGEFALGGIVQRPTKANSTTEQVITKSDAWLG
jgi:hypothetical protein